MGKTKHEKSFVNYDRTYETNIIGLRGIVYFGVGLFLLIVVSFGLMWALQNVMEDNAKETKDKSNPMAVTGIESLPPEPRLQVAPGFGVESERGHVNLELRAPQSEYRNLRDQWEELWKNGQKDPKTGTVVALSMDEAKKKFLEESAKTNGGKTNGGEGGQKVLDDSRSIVSYSSSGRTATDKRR
jgi:hypothetical protein